MFGAFVQADASTTREFGGAGLGLAIARAFMQLMGGSVGASSVPSLGSVFWAELPLEEPAPGARERLPEIVPLHVRRPLTAVSEDAAVAA
jgi:signal transduction histidine kinase